MITHPNFSLVSGLLNFSNLTIHSHCLNFWLMLVLFIRQICQLNRDFKKKNRLFYYGSIDRQTRVFRCTLVHLLN